jgi:hypothetical protein
MLFLELLGNLVNGDVLGPQLKRATLVDELRKILGCANYVKEEFLGKLVAGIRVGCKSIIRDQRLQVSEPCSCKTELLMNAFRDHLLVFHGRDVAWLTVAFSGAPLRRVRL